MSYPRIEVVPRELYYHETAYVRGLEKALQDIAAGNVPTGFLRDVERETKESFQERLNVWMQDRAREALTKAKAAP